MDRTCVRRRRLAAAAGLVAVLLVGVPNLAGAAGPGAAGSLSQAGAVEYVVRPGDTLWDLAVRVQPSSDPRLVVHQIELANPVAARDLVPGQVLLLPEGG